MAPWSTFWDRNVFVEAMPALEHLLASPFSRGAISGIGAITAIAGIAELATAFGARLRRDEKAPPASL